jgi:hypothetical protein
LDTAKLSEQRVDEAAVARILLSIAELSGRRTRPNGGDLTGSFDFWFDGGAGRYITGWTEYEFTDGARAKVDVVPSLSVRIHFPNGSGVLVSQVTSG